MKPTITVVAGMKKTPLVMPNLFRYLPASVFQLTLSLNGCPALEGAETSSA
jgi:hypothetical protein